jgi:hypothetical protein
VLERFGGIPRLEEEEPDPLVRPGVQRVEAERHIPFIERPFEIGAIDEDPGEEVVGIGEVRIATQPLERDLLRGVELAAPAQRLAEGKEDEAPGIGRQLGSEGADVVVHRSTLSASSRVSAASRA